MVIQHDHGAGSQAAAGFGHLGEVHGCVEVLFDDEWGRTASGQQSAKLQGVTHAAGVLFENFAGWVPMGSSQSPGRFTFPLTP